MTTSQLKRQQSQLVPRHHSAFGSHENAHNPNSKGDRNQSSSTNPNAYASLYNPSSYSTLSPLTSLDEDQRRKAIFSDSLGSSGSIHSQQHALAISDLDEYPDVYSILSTRSNNPNRRRCSMSILDESFTPIAHLPASGRRRYSTSSTDGMSLSQILESEDGLTENIPEPLDSQPTAQLDTTEEVKPLSTTLQYSPNLRHDTAPASNGTESPHSLRSYQYTETGATPPTPREPDVVPSSHHVSLSLKLKSAIDSDLAESVFSSYNEFAINDILPSTRDLESVLSFIHDTPSIHSTEKSIKSLEVYTQSLNRGVVPSAEVYTTIISTLLSTASSLEESVSSPIYSNVSRHAKHPYFVSSITGVPVLASLKSLITESSSSSSFVKLAVDIFHASNSVVLQQYPPELYESLIKACVENGQEQALYSIIRNYESRYTTLSAESYVHLVKGYGQYTDLIAFTECYKFYKSQINRFGGNTKSLEMYSALTTAFFDSSLPGAAIAFLKKLLAQSQTKLHLIRNKYGLSDTSEATKSNPGALLGSKNAKKYMNEVDMTLEPISHVISAIVLGFAKIGDFKSSWKWIQKVESDQHLPAVNMSTLISVMKYASDADIFSVSEKLFDYMASRKDSLVDEFNNARTDFLLLCVRAHNSNLLMKAIKESQLRNGVWDLMTLLYVTKYLVQVGDAELAVKVFNQQSERYTSYIKKNNLSSTEVLEIQSTEALAEFLNALEETGNLNVKASFLLSKSSFFSARSFFDNKGGQKMLQTFWDDVSKGGIELASIQVPKESIEEVDTKGNLVESQIPKSASGSSLVFTLADVLSLHLIWIKACSADNTLGGLSIPYPLVDNLRDNFCHFVKSFISQQKMQNEIGFSLSPSFASDVETALDKLDAKKVKSEWANFCEEQFKQEVSQLQIEQAPAKPTEPQIQVQTFPTSSLFWDTTKTSSICLLAAQPHTLYKAFDELEFCISNHILIGPEAYTNIIETAADQKTLTLIQSVYKLALVGLPHPSEHPDAWTAWATVHRTIITKTSPLDKHAALAAYNHLFEMGASPCATGYGQMIANNVTIEGPTHFSTTEHGIQEDSAEALRLFQEAKTRGVPPNTFLYNVVLGKLSKARNFGAAFSVFQDMEFTKTARSSVTYGTMIHASCLANDEKQALKLFEDMEASPFYTPKVAPFNALLQFYVHTKHNRLAALKVYEKLSKRAESGAPAIQPSEHTYRLLIDAFTLIGPADLASADRVLLAISANKSSVTTRHYAALLFARGVICKNVPAVRQFYDGLTLQRRIQPDRHIFQAVIESLVANTQARDITTVLQEMVKFGVDLDDPYLADLLIRAWAREDIKKSVGLFEHSVQTGIADSSTFEAIIRSHIYHNNIPAVHAVFRMMSDLYGPNNAIVQKLEMEFAEKYLNNPVKMAPEVRESVLSESIFRNKDAHALRVLEAAKQSMLDKLSSDPSSYTNQGWNTFEEQAKSPKFREKGSHDSYRKKIPQEFNVLDVPDAQNRPNLVDF